MSDGPSRRWSEWCVLWCFLFRPSNFWKFSTVYPIGYGLQQWKLDMVALRLRHMAAEKSFYFSRRTKASILVFIKKDRMFLGSVRKAMSNWQIISVWSDSVSQFFVNGLRILLKELRLVLMLLSSEQATESMLHWHQDGRELSEYIICGCALVQTEPLAS